MTMTPPRRQDEPDAFVADFESASVIMIFLLMAGSLWLAWRLWTM